MAKVIGLLGKKGAGKDTFFEGVPKDRKFTRFAFGDALKKLCASLGVPLEYFYDTDLKEAPLIIALNKDKEFHKMFSTFGDEFSRFNRAFDDLMNNQLYPGEVEDLDAVSIFNNFCAQLVRQEGAEWLDDGHIKRWWKGISSSPLSVGCLTTPRRIMQIMGTDVMRAKYDDIWINVKFPEGNVMVTDVRFPNECQSVIDRGGKLVRIDNPSIDVSDSHTSETSIDEVEVSHVVKNTGTIEQLHEHAKYLTGDNLCPEIILKENGQ